MNLRIALTALVAAGLTITVPAFAEGRDPAAADALFRSAREAFARGDYATACPRFAESQRLAPAVGTLLNLSACEEKLGKLTVSYAHLVEAIEKLPPRDARLKAATERRDALKSKIPRAAPRCPSFRSYRRQPSIRSHPHRRSPRCTTTTGRAHMVAITTPATRLHRKSRNRMSRN